MGALFAILILNLVTPAAAFVSSQGYYVCSNNTTGVLRMASSTKKCSVSERRYFFVTNVTGDSSNTSNSQSTAQIDYLSNNYGGNARAQCGSGFTSGVDVVTGVTFDKYSTYNPINTALTHLQACSITVVVP